MGSALQRRSLLLAVAVTALSGCQIDEEQLGLRVDREVEPAFLDAIREFARVQGYTVDPDEFATPGYRNIFLRGLRTYIWINGDAGCGFVIRFRNADNPWSFVLPRRDRAQLKQDFEQAILGIQGVSVARVSASSHATCGIE